MGLWFRKSTSSSRNTLWLVKDDPDGSWWCNCPQGIVDVPYHNERTYPTGGEGWLFTCIRCHKAFMFAKAVFIKPTFHELASRATPRIERVANLKTNGVDERIVLANPSDWLDLAQLIAAKIELGKRYVFFDGHVFPAEHGPIRFKGLWRSHDLEDLPHIADSPLTDILGDPDYWLAER